MVPSLIQLCAEKIATTLQNQEMSSQKAVLDSINYMCRHVLLELMMIPVCKSYPVEECRELAAFFMHQKDYFRAFKILSKVYFSLYMQKIEN